MAFVPRQLAARDEYAFDHRVLPPGHLRRRGILVLAMAIGVFRAYRDRKDIKGLMGGAVAFIVIQSALGAMAVLWPQPKAVLALHFGISLVAFVLVVLPTVIMFQLEKGETYRTLP